MSNNDFDHYYKILMYVIIFAEIYILQALVYFPVIMQ